ncbi:MAG: hypothetical protein QOF81_3331, partial [Acidimicrobiaceae bacterium]|nr:hypothetical protein [Acidimicrobiaceae bacterium]
HLPSAVAPAVSGIVGLDDLAEYHSERQGATASTPTAPATGLRSSAASTGSPQPCAAATAAVAATGGYTADQLAQGYGFGDLYARGIQGAGVTVALVELAPTNFADIVAFQSCYGTAARAGDGSVDGAPTQSAPGSIEAVLDTEGVVSLAPQAAVEAWHAPNSEAGVYDVFNYLVNTDQAKVISTSWGVCESALTATARDEQNIVFEQAVAQGQTIVAAAGDSGAQDCSAATGSPALSVDYPASQPLVTGVGGTTLNSVAPASEVVWNDAATHRGAGGGGISSLWPMPAAQHGPGVVNRYSTNTVCGAPAGTLCRQVPDVSASADPDHGYVIYYTGATTATSGWQSVGGTSAAAPLWAAVIALADQSCGCSLGYLNPALYTLAARASGAYHDVTLGNNDYLGVNGGAYPASAGYDMASGLGTPVVSTLVSQLGGLTPPVFRADVPPGVGTVGYPFSYTFTAGGLPPSGFALASGAFPAGLSLDSASGVLSGTPTQPGTSTFAVAAANGVGDPAITPGTTITIVAAPPPRTIVRIAGPGYCQTVSNVINCGDGGPATTAGFNTPMGIAIDNAGNIYIADPPAGVVRKIARNGIISAFAGTGIHGNTGDGGPATAATLSRPYSVAVGGDGSVYIADFANRRVRRVGTDGIIVNFAGDPARPFTSGNAGDGGPAAAATFAGPFSVAVGGDGSVYIADSGNNRVRKVGTDGIIVNFAGNAAGTFGDNGDGGPAVSATLSTLGPIAVDGAGNVFIVTQYRVRKVDTNGIIRNFAGTPGDTWHTGPDGDGGPATRAAFQGPGGIAVDGAGNVYLSDFDRVRVVQVDGVIEDFAGTGSLVDHFITEPATAVALGIPSGIAVNAAGDVYFVEAFAADVRAVLAPRPPAFTADTPPTSATVGVEFGYAFSAIASPPPTYSLDQGTLPPGLTLDPATGMLSGTPSVTGQYAFTVAAANGLGSPALSRPATITVAPAPVAARITSANHATFTVTSSGAFAVTSAGYPTPVVSETGALPAGIAFDAATATFGGTPGLQSAGTYPITVTASNGVGANATQQLTLTVTQAQFTYPTDGQARVDTSQPFNWSTVSGAQGFVVIIGTTPYGAQLAYSGVLAATTTSFDVSALPSGPTLYATLFTELNGSWGSYQAISFTAAPGLATFTYPLDGQAGVDPTRPLTWSPAPGAQGYIVVVGTRPQGTDLANSGVLPPGQLTYTAPVLPARQTLYATVLTKIHGSFSRYQSITFTTGPLAATFTSPTNGQQTISTPTRFSWNTIARAQQYYLVVGTTQFGHDLVDSGLLPPAVSSLTVPKLPKARPLYATILTEVAGNWTYQAAIFTAA